MYFSLQIQIFLNVFVRFWSGMYCRHENGVHPRESLPDLLPAAVEHSAALQQHIDYLAKVIFILVIQCVTLFLHFN